MASDSQAQSDPGAASEPRKRRRVIRPGTEQSGVAGESRDERDEGWSDPVSRSTDSAHDAELRRNLPPHWC